MDKVELNYTHNGSIAQIVLNDGKGNVLDNKMMNELLDIFRVLSSNKDIKLMTFQGEGKHFSFGASVEEHTKENAASMLQTFHKIFHSIIDMGIPTMAKVSGQCLGGGMELAIACNFMFADKTAAFGQPEVVLGVFPPPASIILPLKIGAARAEELLITGRTIKADEALEMGLLNKVFENKDALNKETDEWIEKYIIPKSASSLKYVVKASRDTFNHRLGKGLPVLEQEYVKHLMQTKDANEGINSFLEKRKPVWENC